MDTKYPPKLAKVENEEEIRIWFMNSRIKPDFLP